MRCRRCLLSTERSRRHHAREWREHSTAPSARSNSSTRAWSVRAAHRIREFVNTPTICIGPAEGLDTSGPLTE